MTPLPHRDACCDYMHARYYTFHLGRFMSVDPIGGSIGSSQSWNRYAYVGGNPIKSTDPTGMLTNEYGGPNDQPVNVAIAGTTMTMWDAGFTSITWPAFPNVYIPSKEERFRSAINQAMNRALEEGLLAFPGPSGMTSGPGISSVDIDTLKAARDWTLYFSRMKHPILPYVVGSSAVISGTGTFYTGLVTFGVSIAAFPETGGLSLIATGASVPVMGLGLYQATWGASVVINQTNILFGTHIWSPSDSLPEKWFPLYPSEH